MPDKKNDGPDINKHRLAQQYGFALAFMNSDPELKHLFNQAVKHTWTREHFVARLRGTKWFKHHSVNVRNAILQQKADPATYQDRVNQLEAQVRDTWTSMFGATADNKDIRAWAETAYRMGWSQSQLIDHMTHGVNFQKMLKKKSLGGQAATLKQQIEQTARAYGLNPSHGYVARQIDRVLRGSDTLEGVTARLQDWAKREYKAFAPEIEGGATMQDIAEPYIQKMADLLELDPQTIHMRQKMIQRALRAHTKDGKPAAMSLSAFEDVVRQDPRWQYTDNAREDVANVTANLLKDWGILA